MAKPSRMRTDQEWCQELFPSGMVSISTPERFREIVRKIQADVKREDSMVVYRVSHRLAKRLTTDAELLEDLKTS